MSYEGGCPWTAESPREAVSGWSPSSGKRESITKEEWTSGTKARDQTPADKLRLLEAQLDELGNLPADWDDDGANQISAETVARSKAILRDIWMNCRNRGGELPAPSLGPCADGSIDFFWKLAGGNRRVLLNVLGDSDGSFSGARNGLSISGNARQHLADLVDWLLQK